MKRPAIDGKKIFVNHITERDFYPEYIRKCQNLVLRKQNNSIKKMGKTFEQHFTNEDTWMTMKHIRDVQYH